MLARVQTGSSTWQQVQHKQVPRKILGAKFSLLSQDLYLCKALHKIPKSCVSMEESTTVTKVETSLILVMDEVHHKGGFLGDFKESNSKT
jgi:hypothetical protein